MHDNITPLDGQAPDLISSHAPCLPYSHTQALPICIPASHRMSACIPCRSAQISTRSRNTESGNHENILLYMLAYTVYTKSSR